MNEIVRFSGITKESNSHDPMHVEKDLGSVKEVRIENSEIMMMSLGLSSSLSEILYRWIHICWGILILFLVVIIDISKLLRNVFSEEEGVIV